MSPTPTRPETDPGAVAAMIAELSELTEDEFRDALGENLNRESPVETAAFRSEALVQRTYLAADFLVKQTNNILKRRAGESTREWTYRTRMFQQKAGTERATCKLIIDGARARAGLPPSNAPSPRSRALRELARNHPQEMVALVRKHREAIREEDRAKKAARDAARKAARSAARQ